MKRKTSTCPEKIGGLPVVCTWVEGWQKKMAELIDRKQDFILLGEEEYLKKVKEAYYKKSLKELVKIILLGRAGAVALPGITSTSLSIALGLGFFAAADPEPVSKSVLIAAVAAILGITAAIVIWNIVKLYKDRNIDFVFRVDVRGFEVRFKSY